MNSDLLARIFSFLIFVAFTAVGILFARFRGKLGELRVGQILRHLPKKQYVTVNDLLLFNGGASSQIDHVVVSVYGVFVVETKCYRGWIYGSEKSENWTKNMYGRKYQFRNPLLQNAGHVRALRKATGTELNGVPIIPVVVFSYTCDLKVHVCSPVIYWGQLKKFIREYQRPVMSEERVAAVAALLRSLDHDSAADKKRHKKFARRNAEYGFGK